MTSPISFVIFIYIFFISWFGIIGNRMMQACPPSWDPGIKQFKLKLNINTKWRWPLIKLCIKTSGQIHLFDTYFRSIYNYCICDFVKVSLSREINKSEIRCMFLDAEASLVESKWCFFFSFFPPSVRSLFHYLI